MRTKDKVCKICGKSGFSNFTNHVRSKHGMTMEDYKQGLVEDNKVTEKEPEPVIIEDAKDVDKVIEKKEEPVELLSDFLEEYDVTKEEAIAIIKNFKTGENIPVNQITKRNSKLGEKEANELKDQKEVQTTSLFVAESLVKEHGFKVIKVDSKGGRQPKTWVLAKNKRDLQYPLWNL